MAHPVFEPQLSSSTAWPNARSTLPKNAVRENTMIFSRFCCTNVAETLLHHAAPGAEGGEARDWQVPQFPPKVAFSLHC